MAARRAVLIKWGVGTDVRTVALISAVCVIAVGCGGGGPGSDADGRDAGNSDRGAVDASGAADTRDATDSADARATDGGADGADDAGGADGGGTAADAAGDVVADGPTAGGPFADLRWVSLQAPLGAPITAIAVDSEGVLFAGAGGNTFYGATPSPGIFTSRDRGVSWRAANVGVHDFHIGGLFADGTVLYAGSTALLRSVDRGASWSQLTSATSSGYLDVLGAQGDVVVVGASANGGGGAVLAMNGTGAFHVLPLGAHVNDLVVLGSVILHAGPDGVVRSTDGGATFNTVPGIVNGIGQDASLRCDGVKTCYVSAHTTAQFTPAVILKSVDAGATWTATGKQSPKVVALSDSGALYVSTPPNLARSDDGGATWTPIYRPTTAEFFEPNCDGPFVARGAALYAACIDGVYRSDDKGAHWTPASGTPATGAITGPVAVFAVDNTPTALGPSGDLYLVAAYPGRRWRLLRSSDDGATWQVVSDPFLTSGCIVTGKGALECTAVSYPPAGGTVPLARSEDHGVTWKEVVVNAPGTPTGMQITVSALAGAGSVVYAGSNGLARSDDDGLTFKPLPGSPTTQTLQVLRNGHVLAGDVSWGVYRSTDAGATWKKLARAFPLPVLEDGRGRLLLGDTGGDVVISADEGDSWTPGGSATLPYSSDAAGPLGQDGAGRLVVNALDPGTEPYYARDKALYGSVDGGDSWARLPAAVQLPHPVVSRFMNDRKGRLLAATNGGVYRLQ